MTSHRITYQGPSSFALPAATMLADADGIELTSSQPPTRPEGPDDLVVLALTVEATAEAVNEAVARLRDSMPSEVTIEVEDDPAPS